MAKLDGHRGPVLTVAFSPDGQTLASGSDDTTILLWDVNGFRPEPPKGDADPKTIAQLWDRLKGWDEKSPPYDAVWRLTGHGDKGIDFLAEQLKAVPAPDGLLLRQLVVNLDAYDFTAREAAARELAKVGTLAEPALREAQKNPASNQVAVTLKTILDKITVVPPTDEEVRQSRALLVLEQVGSSAARDLLRRLAGGAEGARLTRDARLALKRLDRLDQFK